MNIVFASDENGVDMLCVTIFSIIKNNQNSKLDFHIINAGISDDSQNRIAKLAIDKNISINFHNVDDSFFNNITPANHKVPRAAYYRYLAPSLLSNQDKALYLDIDMLCVGSINALYETSLGDNYAGAIEDEFALLPDVSGFKKAIGLGEKDRYVNSGCILMNLDSIRKDNVMDTFWDNIRNRDKLIPKKYNKYNDQTLFNITFKGRITYLDARYNTLSILLNNKTFDDNFVILHFAGVDKPIVRGEMNIPPTNNEYYHLYNYYFKKCSKLLGYSDSRAGVNNSYLTTDTHSSDDKLTEILGRNSSIKPDEANKVLTMNDLVGALNLFKNTFQSIFMQKIVTEKRHILAKKIRLSFSQGKGGVVESSTYSSPKVFILRIAFRIVNLALALIFKIGHFLQSKGFKV